MDPTKDLSRYQPHGIILQRDDSAAGATGDLTEAVAPICFAMNKMTIMISMRHLSHTTALAHEAEIVGASCVLDLIFSACLYLHMSHRKLACLSPCMPVHEQNTNIARLNPLPPAHAETGPSHETCGTYEIECLPHMYIYIPKTSH